MIRTIFLSLFFILLCFHSVSGSEVPNLLSDTKIRLTLLDTLRSGANKKGSRVNFKIDESVLDKDGNVLVEKGASAFGTILSSRRRGYFNRRGAMDVSIDFTTSVDGQQIPLRGQTKKAGGGNKAVGVAAAVLWLPMGLLRGSDITIPAGTKFDAFVGEDATIEVAAQKRTQGQGQVAGTPKKFTLNNGDQITGSIVSLENGIYQISTAMGIVSVPEANIRKMEAVGSTPGPFISPPNNDDSDSPANLAEKKIQEMRERRNNAKSKGK